MGETIGRAWTIETIRTIERSPADPKRRDWEEGETETATDETIDALTTHETQIPNENGPA